MGEGEGMDLEKRLSDVNTYLSEGIHSVKGWCIPQLWQTLWPLYREIGDGPVAEIGLFEGKFFIGLCKTFGTSAKNRAAAIDVFDMQQFNLDGAGVGKMDVVKRNLGVHGIAEDAVEFVQADSLALTHRDADRLVREIGQFHFFSVDGCHEVVHTVNDIEFAMSVTANRGIIAVDDFTNTDWPGVEEAVARMYLSRDFPFIPLAVTSNKLLLASYSYHARYLRAIEKYIGSAHLGTRMKKVRRFGYETITIHPNFQAWEDLSLVGMENDMTTTFGATSEFVAYKNTKRSAGSQSEIPTITERNGDYVVAGYQRFSINEIGELNYSAAPEKISRIAGFLKCTVKEPKGMSFLDIGCSAGLLPLLIGKQGFQRVCGVDHDKEYVELFEKLLSITNVRGKAVAGPWNTIKDEQFDVVSVLALVHWIYSMTDKMGSFWQIFEYLRSVCADTLIIEFVDPKDPAIMDLKHIAANPSVQAEEYTYENFLYAARAVFGREIARLVSTPTRYIHIFKKEVRHPGYSSYVEAKDDVVIKRFRPEVINKNPALRSREVQALKRLEPYDVAPSYFFHNDREVHISNVGVRIANLSDLVSPREDVSRILEVLKSVGVRHNDISPANLRVKDGRLYLIDFGWATTDNSVPNELPKNVGVDQGARQLSDPIDDAAMLEKSLALLSNLRA